jgi:polar amino acid transport system permease protein
MRSTTSRMWTWATERHLTPRAVLTIGTLGLLIAFLLFAPRDYDWAWHAIWRDSEYPSFLMGGLVVTAWVSLASLLLALVFGVLGGLARLSRNWFWNQLGTIYVEIVRGTPLLVQIMVAYFCFSTALRDVLTSISAPQFLIDFTEDKAVVGVVALGVFAGAYVAEIVRAAVLSIDKGQSEAAFSQGMTQAQVYRYVVFPQALRRMIPPLTGQFVSLVKDSSLLSVIAVHELTKRASEVRSSSYQTFEVLLPLAAMYLAICFPLSWASRRMELRLVA